MNVLFLITDDMRATISPNGGPIRMPNLERLSARGATFTRAYCQQAICGASRASLLTGMRPDDTRVYDLTTHFRATLPDVVTLPQHFRNNGYTTQRLSKVFHDGVDDPSSWSLPIWQPPNRLYQDAGRVERMVREAEPRRGKSRGPSWESSRTPDEAYMDALTASQAIVELRKRKGEGKPFFMAVGFYKPHLPFAAPQKYYDLYPREAVDMPAHPDVPVSVPSIAWFNSGELRTYTDAITGSEAPPVNTEQTRDLRRGYYAAATFMDAQVGRVLDEVDRLGLRDDTIIVYTADHGFQLGENGQWGKSMNTEIANRIPLIVSVPGRGKGSAKIDAVVESVDIYPTLCAAAGLPVPPDKRGVDLMPLIDGRVKSVKEAAFSQYQRPGTMGYTLRTERWRYTEWKPGLSELYDEANDPDETVNLADRAEYAAQVTRLSRQLREGIVQFQPPPR